ncbi:MAG TPA: HDOD domain-containing protein [Pirellulales bacterium]|nr:HDOD domain-containing protein [Pirellulales bacterium]
MSDSTVSSRSLSSASSPLEELPELRPFPAVASRLMAACRDPSSDSKALAQIIQCDATIALRLLQVANSSLYGFSREIDSVEHAVVILGFRAVKDLALSTAAAEVFSQGAGAAQQRQELWQHSLGCATVARLLSTGMADTNYEAGFLAGIVHDIGKLTLFDWKPDEYEALDRESDVERRMQLECDTFGTTHTEIGARYGDEWGLPPDIVDAICYHHSPSRCENEPLVGITFLANVLAKAWGIGVARDVPADISDLIALSGLPIDEAFLTPLEKEAHAEFERLKRAFAT